MPTTSVETVREYLEMCNETRKDLSACDMTAHDEWVTTFRQTLQTVYGLDTNNPTIVAAVAAGVVEGMGAAIQQGSISGGTLAAGWALYDLALPHFAGTVAA